MVDGINVKEYSLQNLRSLIGLVTQDVFLWNQTIRENLLYANPEVTEEEIIEACKRAQIHDFIKDLPNGYDTVVGERGVRLSGGERQRLAIARVFLHKPDVLFWTNLHLLWMRKRKLSSKRIWRICIEERQ